MIWSTERPISLDTVVLFSKNAFEEVSRTHCLRQVCVDDPILERNVKISALSVSLAFSIVNILRRSKSLDQTKVIKESKLDALETRISILPLSFKFEKKALQLFSQSQSLGRSLYLFSRDGRLGFFYITCYVSDQGKSASFLSEFKTQLKWLQELGIWEGYLTTITEFSLGQTLFLILEAFLFRSVKINIDILMMARTLVKQVRKHLGMYTFLFNRDTKCFFLL